MKFALSALFLLALTGCQTTSQQSGNAPGLPPQDVKIVQVLATNVCVIKRHNSPHIAAKKLEQDSLVINSIGDRENGWRAADVMQRGVRDNIYFNLSKGEVICGGINWAQYRKNKYKPVVVEGLKQNAQGA